MYTKAVLDDIFSYHKPTEDQLPRYEIIRSAAREFANVLVDNTPCGSDQRSAIRHLRKCVMMANASVALNGKY